MSEQYCSSTLNCGGETPKTNNKPYASGLPFSPQGLRYCDVMAVHTPPKTMSEILDRLDVIREELLTLQRSLQKLGTVEAVMPSSKGGVPDGSDVGP